MIRVLGTLLILAGLLAIFFVGTEVYTLQNSMAGNIVLGGVAGLGLALLFKIWKR